MEGRRKEGRRWKEILVALLLNRHKFPSCFWYLPHVLMPQDLCTGSSFCMKQLPPRNTCGFLIIFKSLLRYHLFKEPMLTTLFKTTTLLPLYPFHVSFFSVTQHIWHTIQCNYLLIYCLFSKTPWEKEFSSFLVSAGFPSPKTVPDTLTVLKKNLLSEWIKGMKKLTSGCHKESLCGCYFFWREKLYPF